MITYKGSPLVKGKRFIHEGEIVQYKGKIFNEFHEFTGKNNESIVLTEQEALNLKQYKLLEHSLLSEQDNAEDLKQIVISYTDQQLKLIEKTPGNKLYEELLKSFQEEVKKLQENGMSYQISYKELDTTESTFQEMIMDFLGDINHNVSDTSMPNIYVQLNNYIYNLEKRIGDK